MMRRLVFAYDYEFLHHLLPEKRKRDVQNVQRILKTKGQYLSVCFSIEDPQFGGVGKYQITRLGTTLYFSSEEELRPFRSVLQHQGTEDDRGRGQTRFSPRELRFHGEEIEALSQPAGRRPRQENAPPLGKTVQNGAPRVGRTTEKARVSTVAWPSPVGWGMLPRPHVSAARP